MCGSHKFIILKKENGRDRERARERGACACASTCVFRCLGVCVFVLRRHLTCTIQSGERKQPS